MIFKGASKKKTVKKRGKIPFNLFANMKISSINYEVDLRQVIPILCFCKVLS
jgi:ribosomal protein L25 (general stress protein Ctc)